MIGEVISGEADIALADMTITSTREEAIDFTDAFFQTTTDPLYQKIYAKMQEDPENMMTNSNADGVDKVLASRGTYVYIMESASVDYEVARNCRLTQVGKMFWPRSYGLALAPGSPYREELNKGILRLQETGWMEMLAKKWIGLQGSQCPADQTGLMGWLTSML